MTPHRYSVLLSGYASKVTYIERSRAVYGCLWRLEIPKDGAA
jgi:hypothetical protein